MLAVLLGTGVLLYLCFAAVYALCRALGLTRERRRLNRAIAITRQCAERRALEGD